MTLKIWARILVNILLIFLIMLAPWWFVVLTTVLGLIYFNWYIEAIFFGFFLDSMYGVGGFTDWKFSLFAVIAVIVLLYVKQWIRLDYV